MRALSSNEAARLRQRIGGTAFSKPCETRLLHPGNSETLSLQPVHGLSVTTAHDINDKLVQPLVGDDNTEPYFITAGASC